MHPYMARKPIKKRKQRRVSVNRKPKSVKRKPTFDKIIRTVLAKKAKPLNPKFKLKIGAPEDPFFVHPETIPDGVALQWVMTHCTEGTGSSFPHEDFSFLIYEKALDSGWKPVDGQKPIGSQILVWAPKEVAEAQREADFDRAKEQIREAGALFGLDEYGHKLGRQGFPLVSPSFIVSSDYVSVPDDSSPIEVDVTIKVRMSVRWQNAAACLGLDPQEYARRRLIMEPTILGPCSRAYIYENVSDPSSTYEPVELLTKRID